MTAQSIDFLQVQKRQRLEALAKKIDIKLLLSTLLRPPPSSTAPWVTSSSERQVSSYPVVWSDDGSTSYSGARDEPTRLEAPAEKVDIKLLLSTLLLRRSDASQQSPQGPQSSLAATASPSREALKSATQPTATKRPSVELVVRSVQTTVEKSVQTVGDWDEASTSEHVQSTGYQRVGSARDPVVVGAVRDGAKGSETRPGPSTASSDGSSAAPRDNSPSSTSARRTASPPASAGGPRDLKRSESGAAIGSIVASIRAQSPESRSMSRLSLNGRASSAGGGYASRHLVGSSSSKAFKASSTPASDDRGGKKTGDSSLIRNFLDHNF